MGVRVLLRASVAFTCFVDPMCPQPIAPELFRYADFSGGAEEAFSEVLSKGGFGSSKPKMVELSLRLSGRHGPPPPNLKAERRCLRRPLDLPVWRSSLSASSLFC